MLGRFWEAPGRLVFSGLTAVFLVASQQCLAQAGVAESEKREQIRQIMSITGTLQIADQMLDAMIAQLAPVYEQLNPEEGALAASIMKNEFRDVFHEREAEFEDMLVDIYDGNFSAEETAQLLEFYRSPLGRRLIERMPAVVAEATRAGQAFGAQVSAEAYDRAAASMRAQGLNTPN